MNPCPIDIPMCLMSNDPRAVQAAIISPLPVLSGYRPTYVPPPFLPPSLSGLTNTHALESNATLVPSPCNYYQWDV